MFRKSMMLHIIGAEGLVWLLQLYPSRLEALEANPLKQGIEALGPFPILQMGAAVSLFIVICIGSLLFLKGMKLGKSNAEANVAPVGGPTNAAPAMELYFNGPLKAIFEMLSDIKGRQLIGRLELKEDFAILLSQSRHSLGDKLVTVQASVHDCVVEGLRDQSAALENRFRDLNGNINQIHHRMDDMQQLLARLDATVTKRRT
jgi:hypothetical protein